MIDERPTQEAVDGTAWIYLIASGAGPSSAGSVRERIAEVCEEGGWPTIGRPAEDPDYDSDPGHHFEDVHHAVEHADCVVALLDDPGEIADSELALAYSHRRPIVGIQVAAASSSVSAVQAMLGSYERAQVISCQGPEDCGNRLRAVLSDPDFSATMRQAIGERAASP